MRRGRVAWVKATIRGQAVWARADVAGALRVDGGRVEIRYNPSDGRKYLARAENLTVTDAAPLPDDTCSEVQPEAPRPTKSKKGKAKGAKHSAVAASTEALPTDAVIAYADGACSGNPGPAGLGVVILDGNARVEISEYLGEATNNIAELTAVQRAMEAIADPTRTLVIHTDSQYTIGVVQKGWKAKANLELVRDLKEALAERSATRLVYVPGHAGVPLNERADELARQAVRDRTTVRNLETK